MSNLSVDSVISRSDMQILLAHSRFNHFHGKRILITGGTGMIGSYLTEAIVRGCEIEGFKPSSIFITGNSSVPSRRIKFEKLKFVDVVKYNAQNRTINEGRFDYVIHLASPASPKNFLNLESLKFINADCLDDLFQICTTKFIYMSSGEVYGNSIIKSEETVLPKFDDFNVRRNWYPYSKIVGEQKCNELSASFKVDTAAVRLFHTFGPGIKAEDGRSFADFLYEVSYGKRPKLKSDGSDIRTFLYILDAIIAILLILEKSSNKSIYNVGGDSPLSILEFAKKISLIAGMGGETDRMLAVEKDYAPSPFYSAIPNISKISALGWEPKVNLDEAIKKTLEYIKSTLK